MAKNKEQPAEPEQDLEKKTKLEFHILKEDEFEQERDGDISQIPISNIQINNEGNLVVFRDKDKSVITEFDANGRIIKKKKTENIPFLNLYINGDYKKLLKKYLDTIKSRWGNSEKTNQYTFEWIFQRLLQNVSFTDYEYSCIEKIFKYFYENVFTDKPNLATPLQLKWFFEIPERMDKLIDDLVSSFKDLDFTKNYFLWVANNQEILSQGMSWINLNPLKISITTNEKKLYILNRKNGDDPKVWSLQQFEIPLEKVTGYGIDFKGNYLFISSGDTIHVYDWHSEPFKEVAKIQEKGTEFIGTVTCTEDGTILVGTSKGEIKKITSNLDLFPSYEEAQRRKVMLQRALAQDIKKTMKEKTGKALTASPAEFEAIANKVFEQFKDDIESATAFEHIHEVRQEVDKISKEYEKIITEKALLEELFRPLYEKIAQKEEEILAGEVVVEQEEVAQAVEKITTMNADEIFRISVNAGKLVNKVNASARITGDVRKKALKICETFNEKAADVLKANEQQMIDHLETRLKEEKDKLNKMTKLSELETWVEVDYPTFRDYVTHLLKQAPISHKKFLERCLQIDKELTDLKDEYVKKFREQYKEIRQNAVERNDMVGGLIEKRVEEFIEDLEAKVKNNSFKSAKEAQKFVNSSRNYQSIITSIEEFISENPDKAGNLSKKLKVKIAELIYNVKQMQSDSVDQKTGKQMIKFGNVSFPIWEHKTKEKTKVRTELAISVDERTKGPGVKPEDYYCELMVKVQDSSGKSFEIPFHEDQLSKYGLENEKYYETPLSPSYITVKEAKKIIKTIKEMDSAKPNDLKTKYNEFRKKIEEFNEKFIQTIKTKWKGKWLGPKHAAENSEDKIWQTLLKEQENLTKEYVKFIQKSGLYAWLKLQNIRDRFSLQKEVFKNGQGYVPEKNPSWVRDPQTEKYLEEFAYNAKMSLEINDGLISLEGHAGTGKDVLVDMFCEATKRPKFTFDCSKWTTEFELSQDVSLSAEGGASFTVKEDSIVVKAMETPGALLYFNEFNALPEQAQIFLHSLFDAKRQLTLKTSSGRIVKMEPTVIICSSMNPGYKGTNDPQLATRSRMIPLKVSYPEFKRSNGTFAPSEGLRIARAVKSLEDLTLNRDMEKNEFVNAWEGYINRHEEVNLTPEQKFDMEVIFALVTFANNIREAFIKTVEKTLQRGDLNINQPFTGREMRRCAYMLSHMEPSQKEDLSKAEDTAKDMIRKIYSVYMFSKKEFDAFETQLKIWTTQKP